MNQLGTVVGSCALANKVKKTDFPTSTTPKPKGQGEDNRASTSSDNSDDDDGFLESWFENENRAPFAFAPGDFHPEDARHERNRIELGVNFLRWISGTRSKYGEDVICSGVVALRHSSDEHKDSAVPRTSTLRVSATTSAITTTTSAINPRKRSRAGYELSTDTALEQVTLAGSDPGQMVNKNCDRLTRASNKEGLSTIPGAMVDCLARYDSQRECYVLGVVGLLVDKIET